MGQLQLYKKATNYEQFIWNRFEPILWTHVAMRNKVHERCFGERIKGLMQSIRTVTQVFNKYLLSISLIVIWSTENDFLQIPLIKVSVNVDT